MSAMGRKRTAAMGGKRTLANWRVTLMRLLTDTTQIRHTRVDDWSSASIEMDDLS
jgi:hypothetical protein